MYEERMPIFGNLRMCMNSKKTGLKRRPTKIPFNVRVENSFKNHRVPSQLRDLLVFIAREGVAQTDLFRRPGNPKDMKIIMNDLQAGKKIDWSQYNFYTLANVSKKFLLNIEGGLLGAEAEFALIQSLEAIDDHSRIEAMHNVIMNQPKHVQQFMALLFGIWFRMIYHTEVNAMSVEAVAKSVAGSVFPNYCTSPKHVEEASKVMEYLITGFASSDLFGTELIEFFANETMTSISRVEKYQYEFRFPKSVPKDVSLKFFNKILLREAKHYGFDPVQNMVDKATFESTNWAYHVSAPTQMPVSISDEKENRPAAGNSSSQKAAPAIEVTTMVNNFTTVFNEASEEATLTSTRTTTKKAHEVLVSASQTRTAPLLLTMTTNAMTPKLQRHASTASKHNAANEETMGHEKRSRIIHEDPILSINSPVTCMKKSDLSVSQAELESSAFRSQGFVRGSFSSVRRRQLERQQKRTAWFLSPPPGKRPTELAMLSGTDDDFSSSEGDHSLRVSQSCYEGFSQHSPVLSLPQLSPNNNKDDVQLEVRYFVVKRYYGASDVDLAQFCPFHLNET